jgi:hypothetical protein
MLSATALLTRSEGCRAAGMLLVLVRRFSVLIVLVRTICGPGAGTDTSVIL